MSNIYLSISDGKIDIRCRDVTTSFESEDEAAKHLASCLMATGDDYFMNSSSCDFPEDDGRPDFNLEEFEKKALDKYFEMVA